MTTPTGDASGDAVGEEIVACLDERMTQRELGRSQSWVSKVAEWYVTRGGADDVTRSFVD